MKVDTNFWITREGIKIDISKMEESHFKNTVNYILIESTRYNNDYLKQYIPRIIKECSVRSIDPMKILQEGLIPYKDRNGVLRIWDEETNTELACN